jgi:hypothetical protein
LTRAIQVDVGAVLDQSNGPRFQDALDIALCAHIISRMAGGKWGEMESYRDVGRSSADEGGKAGGEDEESGGEVHDWPGDSKSRK